MLLPLPQRLLDASLVRQIDRCRHDVHGRSRGLDLLDLFGEPPAVAGGEDDFAEAARGEEFGYIACGERTSASNCGGVGLLRDISKGVMMI